MLEAKLSEAVMLKRLLDCESVRASSYPYVPLSSRLRDLVEVLEAYWRRESTVWTRCADEHCSV